MVAFKQAQLPDPGDGSSRARTGLASKVPSARRQQCKQHTVQPKARWMSAHYTPLWQIEASAVSH